MRTPCQRRLQPRFSAQIRQLITANLQVTLLRLSKLRPGDKVRTAADSAVQYTAPSCRRLAQSRMTAEVPGGPSHRLPRSGGALVATFTSWPPRQSGGSRAKVGQIRAATFRNGGRTRLPRMIMDLVTQFLRSYLVPAGTGLAGDPGLKWLAP